MTRYDMALSEPCAIRLLDHIFGGTTFSPPTEWWVGLGASDCGGVLPFDELSDDSQSQNYSEGYIRQRMEFYLLPYYNNGYLLYFADSGAARFPAAVKSSWANVYSLGIFDRLTPDENQDDWLVYFHANGMEDQEVPIGKYVGTAPFEFDFTTGIYGGFSPYLERKLMELLFNKQSFTQPSNLYMAIGSNLQDDGSMDEPSTSDGYARQQVSSWSTPEIGADDMAYVAPNDDVQFGPATADWDDVSQWALFDASSGGNLLFFGNLPTPFPIAINNGDDAAFSSITIKLK